MARIFLLLTLIPLVELVLLAWIGSKTSWLAVVLLVLGTGIAGAALLRRQGWQTIARVRGDVAAQRAPADSLLDGLLVVVAGVLLILPGVLSDLVAIVLLIPITRGWIKLWLRAHFVGRVTTSFAGFAPAGAGRPEEIIDVRVIDSPAAALKQHP